MQHPETITISSKPAVAPKPSRVDLQDALLVLGFCCLEAGVAVIYWPAALILAGVLFLAAALRPARVEGHKGRRAA